MQQKDDEFSIMNGPEFEFVPHIIWGLNQYIENGKINFKKKGYDNLSFFEFIDKIYKVKIKNNDPTFLKDSKFQNFIKNFMQAIVKNDQKAEDKLIELWSKEQNVSEEFVKEFINHTKQMHIELMQDENYKKQVKNIGSNPDAYVIIGMILTLISFIIYTLARPKMFKPDLKPFINISNFNLYALETVALGIAYALMHSAEKTKTNQMEVEEGYNVTNRFTSMLAPLYIISEALKSQKGNSEKTEITFSPSKSFEEKLEQFKDLDYIEKQPDGSSIRDLGGVESNIIARLENTKTFREKAELEELLMECYFKSETINKQRA